MSAEVLGRTELFRELAREDLDAIASRGIVRSYPKGQILFYQQDPGDTLYVILEGRVKAFVTSEDGAELHLGFPPCAGSSPLDFVAFGDGAAPRPRRLRTLSLWQKHPIASPRSARSSLTSRSTFDVDRKRARLEEVKAKAAAPDLWDDPPAAQKVMAEMSRLGDDVGLYDSISGRVDDAELMWELAESEGDAGTAREVEGELGALEKEIESLEVVSLLGGEFDANPAILSVNAGEGGTDSQDWAEQLLRMYLRWAERRGFKTEILEATAGEEAGLKSATATVTGRHAYGLLAAERGVHRLVRISPFDAAKRRHTSFASVDVAPEVEDDIEIEISPDDLRVDTYRSSGAGGQHVNVTDSAVRITHLPTGIVVSCQNERSQMQNRAVALRVLKSRLLARAHEEREAEIDALRGERREIGFGSQIRSYVMHPYQMVKDHRTDTEAGNVHGVLDGDIDSFIEAELKRKATVSHS